MKTILLKPPFLVLVLVLVLSPLLFSALPSLLVAPGARVVPGPTLQETELEGVFSETVGKTFNVHRSGELWLSGQFPPEDLALFQERGVLRVISLRRPGELDWDERALVEEAGLEFISMPLGGPDTLTEELVDRLRAILRSAPREGEGATLLHCASARRVGAVWFPFRVLDQGVPAETALTEARTVGLSSAEFEAWMQAYIAGRQEEPSVKTGINDSFKDPELNVDDFVARFEIESREVYAARMDVLAACRIEPGMRVADIGAGTGLYTRLFTRAVGAEGWVYAVDIAPRFLQHILASMPADARNVSPVLCPENSVSLPPASVDLAFVCDTYHHFEFPRSTLASIQRALRPGGRLILLDFERVPGVTRPWLLEHVRAGKQVFQAEVEAAGFELVRQVDVKGLEENYLLEFRRPR